MGDANGAKDQSVAHDASPVRAVGIDIIREAGLESLPAALQLAHAILQDQEVRLPVNVQLKALAAAVYALVTVINETPDE
jgi:hypothetical protein